MVYIPAGVRACLRLPEQVRSLTGDAQAGKAKQDGSLQKYGIGIKNNDMPCCGSTHPDNAKENAVESITKKQEKSAWARLIKKVYEVDPLVCPKCSSDMKVVAIITNPAEISRILECLKKNKDPPFDNLFSEAS